MWKSVRHFLAAKIGVQALQERLQFFQQDERIVRLDAELRPGAQRGEGTLSVKVEEANPFKVEFAFNNYQSPTVGAARELIPSPTRTSRAMAIL
jgi:hemolysin activation/secretion protein